MINQGLSEIIGPFPVPSPRDMWEWIDDPGHKRRGDRYSVHLSNHAIPIDYRDRGQSITLTTLIRDDSEQPGPP